MTPEQVTELRILQVKARSGTLSEPERARWVASRALLERALSQAQLLLAPSSALARRSFRVICALDLELEIGGALQRTQTTNFSTGGFSTLLDCEPPRDTGLPFALSFPGAEAPVRGLVRCRGARRAGARWRASFEFMDLSPQDRNQIELEVVDLEIEMLWPAGRLAP